MEAVAVLVAGASLVGALVLLVQELGATSAGGGLAGALRGRGLPPLVCGLVLAGGAWLAWPLVVDGHHYPPCHESAAIGALKSVGVAQTLYREDDRDRNGVQDYAPSLAALCSNQLQGGALIDAVLGSGTKQGYGFRLERLDPDRWRAYADPTIPGTTGDRHFATDQSGAIWFTSTGPVTFLADGSTDAVPLGR